ncbi:histidine phosphatase family protein [Acetobacter sp. AN02]|uniref:histidine phosphatase family protein n=1 Tax=Acetobacter sp. AN02 TaxID=2894186 RepID=UPI0024342A97|nr:histidine phosphatase family protein [Acetobacter sp. AN02]MDG6093838.1 histidine phosphatase family protein [Acetobacter sp. AN02]
MLDRKSFWYLRHGETAWNRQGLSQGRTDIPLNETGIAQAHAAGSVLHKESPGVLPVARIVSSPLSRALRTAEIAASYLQTDGRAPVITTDKDLEEVCFGEQEGQPMGDWYDDWVAGTFTPPGAENFAELRARAVAAVNRATQGEGTVLIVAHGALFRAIRSAMGLVPNVRLPNAVPLTAVPPVQGEAEWTLTVFS